MIEGTVDLNGIRHNFFGEGTALTPAISAYVAFSSGIPSPLYIAFAKEAFGIPNEWLPIVLQSR